ncbi:MAG: YidC/Oxa1 family membrane protein insertase [Clostridia bacterium]|nr:YidC/Oxa1 family membrane protein insertase [Clostridia bacterium]
MELMNLMEVALPIYSQSYSISLNWIGKIILWLTTTVGSVGVGIILFSLLLKLVTMPFDVYQRINMRKQNIKMKENKERMEKLQKQYANDKEKYNQKVMEMYRESGISVMSSCLPMILSLVIFIVAINAFNAFSSYSNVENYNTLVGAYNERMLENCAELTEDNLECGYLGENGEYHTVVYTVKDNKAENKDKYIYYTVSTDYEEGVVYADFETAKEYIEASEKVYYHLDVQKYFGADMVKLEAQTLSCDVKEIKEGETVKAITVTYTVKDAADYIYYYEVTESLLKDDNGAFYSENGNVVKNESGCYELVYDKASAFVQSAHKTYYVIDDAEAVKAKAGENSWQYALVTSYVQEAEDEEEEPVTMTSAEKAAAFEKALVDFLVVPAQEYVAEVYQDEVKEDTKFLWIKNVWAVDASYKHPVLKYGDFSEEIVTRKSCSCKEGDTTIRTIDAYTEDGYDRVTAKLDSQKSEPNGYYIMILLSIGTILLQQFVSMRSQKEQTKYSSVDGQSGSQQKIMMIVMTVMFAVFSFLYSSAFAIYLVVSNLFALFSMLVINKFVDSAMAKKENAGVAQGENMLSGRAAAIRSAKNKFNENGKKPNSKKRK